MYEAIAIEFTKLSAPRVIAMGLSTSCFINQLNPALSSERKLEEAPSFFFFNMAADWVVMSAMSAAEKKKLPASKKNGR